jgi:hypothetical protein
MAEEEINAWSTRSCYRKQKWKAIVYANSASTPRDWPVKQPVYDRTEINTFSKLLERKIAKLTQENSSNRALCSADNCSCTGVNVGGSFVNSSSKLPVYFLSFYKVPQSFQRFIQEDKNGVLQL